MNKSTLIHALGAFIAQRSGIKFHDYFTPGTPHAEYFHARELFKQDYDPILKHGRHARKMLEWVSRKSISTEDLLKAAGSGRLSFVFKGDSAAVDYCIGQYFPTEYRAAACSFLARAIWDYFRNGCNYSPDQIRRAARREFGRGIASAWF